MLTIASPYFLPAGTTCFLLGTRVVTTGPVERIPGGHVVPVTSLEPMPHGVWYEGVIVAVDNLLVNTMLVPASAN